MEDLVLYKETKRNEKYPCGGGKILKKCCMNAYRKAKQGKPNVKISPYSSLPPVSTNDKRSFINLYEKLLLFSHQYKNNSDTIFYF